MSLADRLNRAPPKPALPAPPAQRRGGLAEELAARADIALEARAPENFAEIRRICGLPCVQKLEPEELEAFCRMNLLAKSFDNGFRLHDVQAAALLAYDIYNGGLFLPIGVGWGKSLVGIMVAERYHRAGGQRSLLMLPAQVMRQFATKHVGFARARVPLTVPFFEIGSHVTKQKRQGLLNTKFRGCYMVAYEMLSHPKAQDLIDRIEPGLIIGDEAHNLASPNSVRTKRFMRYVKDKKPRCVFMSGTITGKKIRDYWHLIKAALDQGCPLPLSAQLAAEWGVTLDSGAQPTEAQTGPVRPLIDWARKHAPPLKDDEQELADVDRYPLNVTGFRNAYRLRLTTTPGVIATGEHEIGTSLVICNSPAPWNPAASADDAKLEMLARQVEQEWLTPTGDEIDYAIHKWKWLYELSAGFYNELYWPDPAALAAKRGIPESEAASLLERAKEHHLFANLYSRELRAWLKERSRPGLDSPMLVASSMRQHQARDVGEPLWMAYQDMKLREFDGMPERWSRAIRVSDYKLRHIVSWAKELQGEGGVIWVHHVEVGVWLVELLRAAGLNVLHAPAGENDEIVDERNKHKVVVASLTAHGTGKDGMQQMFRHQFYAQSPRSAKLAEQSLGRLHREGQSADELVTWRCDTPSIMIVRNEEETPFDSANFAACLNDAVYIHSTTGLRQKLVYAAYDPLPEIYPSEWLIERGFQAKKLNAEQRRLLAEQFGGD